MTHVRKQIRDLAAEAVDWLTTTGTRVYSDRIVPIPQDKLPALRVFFTSETGEMERGAMGADPAMHPPAGLNVVGYADGAGRASTLESGHSAWWDRG